MKYGYLCEKDAAGKPRITLYHSTVCAFRRPFLPHHHTECELALIGSGTGVYTVKNRSFSFAAGDIFLFRGDELHCITEVCADEKFDVTNIHFEPSFVWSGEGLGSPSLWRLFCDRSPRFENRIERNNPQTAKIAEKIRRIEEELQEQKFERLEKPHSPAMSARVRSVVRISSCARSTRFTVMYSKGETP